MATDNNHTLESKPDQEPARGSADTQESASLRGVVQILDYLLSVIRPVKFYSRLSAGFQEEKHRYYRIALLILLISTFLSVIEMQWVSDTHRELFYLGFLTPQENYWWEMVGAIPTAFCLALLVKLIVRLFGTKMGYGTAFVSVAVPEVTHIWGVVPLIVVTSVPESPIPAYIVGSFLALWTLYLTCVALSSFIKMSIAKAIAAIIISVFAFYVVLGTIAVVVHSVVLRL